MKNKNISFEESRKELKKVFECIEIALEYIKNDSKLMTILAYDVLDNLYEKELKIEFKKDKEFKEEQIMPAVMVHRNIKNDRTIPVETVVLNDFSLKHKKEIEKAIIHLGSYSDEYVRSHHALALVVGTDIFFRNGAYKPETEEGRKIIAHELTHVAQNKEEPFVDHRTREELEEEAEETEVNEQKENEKLVILNIGNKKYKLRKSLAKEIDELTEKRIKDWIEEEKSVLNDAEQIKLEKVYSKYLEEREKGKNLWAKK